MKISEVIYFFFAWAGVATLAISGGGCEVPVASERVVPAPPGEPWAGYAPAQLVVMPLTEFVKDRQEQRAGIKAYVSLLDGFGSQVKAPAILRFELYESLPHSGRAVGKRISFWPDFDLRAPGDNNRFWRDFLRAYEFRLEFEPAAGRSYLLKATCFCPGEKRLSGALDVTSP